MKTYIQRHLAIIALVVIVFIVFVTNVKEGTYLIGWDHLSTELNPLLAVKRAFFAVWQEYQSLGLVGGMAHASDLIHAVFVSILALVIPQSLNRYVVHCLLLLAGAIGIHKLIEFYEPREKQIAFLGALFYMFNIGTIQLFYVPFEPFSWFFAALPWELWIFSKVLKEKTGRRNLLLFLIINLLSTPQAYLQTLFVVYVIVLACLASVYLWGKRSFQSIKKVVLLFFLLFLVNSFWILPQLYFLIANGGVITQAKINQLATEDVFFQNYEKGTISNFVSFKGFYFDLFRSNQERLFLEWHNHFSQAPFKILSYILSAVVLIGVFMRGRKHKAFLLVYIVCAIALLSATPVISEVNNMFRTNGFFNQIFRSPFTKFVIPYSLVSSFFFAQGAHILLKKLSGKGKNIAFCFLAFAVLTYTLPSFKGYFFSPSMKIKLPQEYLEAIEYFKHQDINKRIAILPDHTFWGWFYQSWGYNGSGFMWYGIEQPMLSRTFDVWSGSSERYFWELKQAVDGEKKDDFIDTLTKYDVAYVIFDKSHLSISSITRSLQYESLTKLLKDPHVKLVKKGKVIDIYQIMQDHKVEDFVSLASSLSSVSPAVSAENNDNVYKKTGGYMTDGKPILFYPFRDVMSRTRLADKKWSLVETERSFELRTNFDSENFQVAETSAGKYGMPLNTPRGVETFQVAYQIKVEPHTIVATIPKTLVSTIDVTKTELVDCGQEKGIVKKLPLKNGIRVGSDQGAVACFGYNDPFLEQQYGYLIKVKNNNLVGRRLFFYILDDTKKQSYLEERLQSDTDYFFLGPKYQYGLGYGLTFQGNSYKNVSSVNELAEVKIYAFPYNAIKDFALLRKGSTVQKSRMESVFSAKKTSYFTYDVALKNTDKGTLILSQSYDNGWKAYQDNKELEEHVLVNNWANGWSIDQNSGKSVSIIFWPQYLEFAGFLLLVFAFGITVFKKES